jgi:serine/threonine protein kinase
MAIDSTARIDERYRLGILLGRGGMADVYQATDTVLGREVALKVLRGSTASEADRARFLGEARILAQLSHPGLVTLLDAGVRSKEPYLVMELVRGSTLAEREGPFDPSEVAAIGVQLAEAIAYAHDAGVVHRDVKPGNVLVDDD